MKCIVPCRYIYCNENIYFCTAWVDINVGTEYSRISIVHISARSNHNVSMHIFARAKRNLLSSMPRTLSLDAHQLHLKYTMGLSSVQISALHIQRYLERVCNAHEYIARRLTIRITACWRGANIMAWEWRDRCTLCVCVCVCGCDDRGQMSVVRHYTHTHTCKEHCSGNMSTICME